MQDGDDDRGEGKNAGWMDIPGDDDPEWEHKMAPVFERLGRPKDAKAYAFDDPKDFELDDVDKEYRESFRPVAHRLGLTQKQVKGLAAWQTENVKLIRDAEKAKRDGASSVARSALEREWGRNFSARLKGANQALEQFGGKEGRALASTILRDGSRLGDKIEFVRMMANINANAQKAAAVVDRSAPTIGASGSEPEAALEEIEAIKDSAVRQGLDPTHSRWPHRQLEQLYEKAYGSEPLDTSYGSDVNARHRRK
jgi:hypothetical protein